MTKEFALDLKVARQNSGLTQQDCAHLLGVSDATLAKIEAGKRTPSICEICTLSLIYGRSFESLFSGIFRDVRAHLSARMTSLPEPSGKRKSYANSIELYRKVIERDLARKHYGLRAPLLVLWVFNNRTNEARFLEMLGKLNVRTKCMFLSQTISQQNFISGVFNSIDETWNQTCGNPFRLFSA